MEPGDSARHRRWKRLFTFLGRGRVRRALAFAKAACSLCLPRLSAPRRADTAPTGRWRQRRHSGDPRRGAPARKLMGGAGRRGRGLSRRGASPARITALRYSFRTASTRPWIPFTGDDLSRSSSRSRFPAVSKGRSSGSSGVPPPPTPGRFGRSPLVAIAWRDGGRLRGVPRPRAGTHRRILDMHALRTTSLYLSWTPAGAHGDLHKPEGDADGSLLLARNFDFEGGDIFDRQKLVSVVAPAEGIPYLSVGFSGMLGVVPANSTACGSASAMQAISRGRQETAASRVRR